MNRRTKNMVRGVIFMMMYVISTLIIPIITFSVIRTIDVSAFGITVNLAQESYAQIIYWILALGLIICGFAFFTFSSPKQSIRRGFSALVQVFLNCLYIWSYKFSGATDIRFEILGLGGLTIDIANLVMVYLGIYFLLIIIKLYDFIDFIVNRKKIR
ncbi:MAG: hypothetical protein ACFFDN_51500, partial [Candidatus Hodarchaeota archaeon]